MIRGVVYPPSPQSFGLEWLIGYFEFVFIDFFNFFYSLKEYIFFLFCHDIEVVMF